MTAQRCLLEGDGSVIVEVSTTLGCMAGGGGYSAKEGIKYIAEAARVKAFKALPEKSLGAAVPKAVVGGSFFQVGEHLVSLVYLFEFLPCLVVMIVVRVILKG